MALPSPPMTLCSSAVTTAFIPLAQSMTACRSRGLIVLTLTTFTDTPSAFSSSAAVSARDTMTPLANTTTSFPSCIVYSLPISNGGAVGVTIGRSLRLMRIYMGPGLLTIAATILVVSTASTGTSTVIPGMARMRPMSSTD